MNLVWSDHGRPIRRATANYKQTWYEVGYHFSKKCFYCEAQAHGRQIFFDYADTLEEAKEIAEAHAFDFDEALKDL
jgi:hypothetical protein